MMKNIKLFDNKFNLIQFIFEKNDDKKNIAFVTFQSKISYQQLEMEVKWTAAALKRQGILPIQRIIISLNDSLELIVLFLAAIAIGACPIILNPHSKPRTVEYIARDSGAVLFFFESESYGSLKEIITNIENKKIPVFVFSREKNVEFENIRCFLSPGSDDFDYHQSGINEMALMQYTSGTTGDPKGVMHSSQAILSSCQLFAGPHLQLCSEDILYSTSKMFFGYGLGNSLFFPLYFGARALIDSRWPTNETILENVIAFNPTLFFSTPVIYKNICNQNTSQIISKTCRLLFSGGAPLPEKLQNLWNDQYQVKIYEGLGATEMCHVFITNDSNHFKPGSAGKLINGYKYRLVDQAGIEITGRSSGILEISGQSIALGYWNKQDVTRKNFKNGWYHTGDIFSIDEDGFFYYRGREDDLFKVKGRWVIPSEIESYLKNIFFQIDESFLVPRNDGYQIQPVLFVIKKNNKKDEENEILTASILKSLANNFESYKIPIDIIYLDSLPYNDNGKIVRSILANHAVLRPEGV